MKLAIMLAGMASGNKIARDPTQLIRQGTRLVQSNPQLSALTDQVRGRLLEAGKGVAVAVVSKQMDSLSDRLSERTDRLSGRLDEATDSFRTTRPDHGTDETDLVDDWADEEDPAEQDRDGRQDTQPRPRRTTTKNTTTKNTTTKNTATKNTATKNTATKNTATKNTAGSSGTHQRSIASPPRKGNRTSSAANGSDQAAGSTVRHRTAGGTQVGGRNA